MTKLLALATALIFTVASFATTAEAGMRVGIGIGIGGVALGAMSNGGGGRSEAREYSTRKKERASRREKAPSRTAKKSKSEPAHQASKEAVEKSTASSEASGIATNDGAPVPPSTTGSTDLAATQSENSSISLASASTADASKTIDTASQETKNLDCKKFFPSVGMTLSAPCE
jgi:hypothetical protein